MVVKNSDSETRFSGFALYFLALWPVRASIFLSVKWEQCSSYQIGLLGNLNEFTYVKYLASIRWSINICWINESQNCVVGAMTPSKVLCLGGSIWELFSVSISRNPWTWHAQRAGPCLQTAGLGNRPASLMCQSLLAPSPFHLFPQFLELYAKFFARP